MIGQEMAIHHPKRVRGLVSIMSSSGRPGLPGPKPEAAAIMMAPPPATREDYIAQFGRTWTVLRFRLKSVFPQYVNYRCRPVFCAVDAKMGKRENG